MAKGFRQREGIDYVETFSPVAMLKSIQILLASFIDLSMVSIKHQGVRIIGLMRLSVLMVSLRTTMSHVFTRGLVGGNSLS